MRTIDQMINSEVLHRANQLGELAHIQELDGHENLFSTCDWLEPALWHVDNEMTDDEKAEYLANYDPSPTATITGYLTSGIIDPEEFCEEFNIEAYEREVLEYWIVTRWFAEKLEAQGEAVAEILDFHIWGRTTSGQSITMDGVIADIHKACQS